MEKYSFGSLCENCKEDTQKDFCTKCNRFICLNRKCLKEHNGHFIIYFETIVQHHSSLQLREFCRNSVDALKSLRIHVNDIIDIAISQFNKELLSVDSGKVEFERAADEQKLSDQTLQIISQASSTLCFKSEFAKFAEDFNQKELQIKSQVSKSIATLVEEYMYAVTNPEISTDNKFIHYGVSDTSLVYLFYPLSKKLVKLQLKDHLPTDFDSIEVSGNIYFMGGYKGNAPIADNSMLKIENAIMCTKEQMITAKYYHTLCRLSSKCIFSIGGYDYAKSIDDCERYNIIENNWTRLPNLLRPTNEPAACIFKDRFLYSICGYDSVTSVYLDLMQRLDLSKNDKWEKIVVALPSRLGAYAASLGDSSILLFGGYNGAYYNNSVVININEDDKHVSGAVYPLTVSGEYFYKSSSVMTIQKKIYAISSNQNLFVFSEEEKKWNCMLKKEWQGL